jgi:hypothetical protein
MGEPNKTRTTAISDDSAAVDVWALHESLPHTLPADEILAVNKPKPDLHTHRMYSYNGWSFELPPGVFMPGETSRMVHDRLLDSTIPVAGRTYVAMGAGLGVEAVAAGIRGAREIYAIDVDADSVKAMAEHYDRIVGERPGTAFHPLSPTCSTNSPNRPRPTSLPSTRRPYGRRSATTRPSYATSASASTSRCGSLTRSWNVTCSRPTVRST